MESAPPELSGAAAGWNLLLISVDTLRADHLGAYGYTVRPTSPKIDELMNGGVRFAQAVAPRALTWPSMASVLTGLYPSGHGIIANGYEFPEELEILPERLQAAGYKTGAFLSNMCSAGHQGWDELQCSQGRDARSVASALAWAGEQPAESPTFVWIHLFGAHGPYYNGGDLAARELDPDYDGDLIPKKWRLDRVMTEREELTEADLRHLRAIYDAAILGTDRRIDELLAGLGELGALENTLIVFLADHGEDLYDHNGYLYHACSVYQSSLHVPLGFHAAGLLPPGGVVEAPVELSDVAPTVLELLGMSATGDDIHGASLVPYLRRPDAGGTGKPAFSEFDDTRLRTVQVGRWKLVDNPDGLTPFCFPNGPKDLYPIASTELYDLLEDPGERTNLAAAQPAKVAELRQLLVRRFSGLKRRVEPQEIDEKLKEELQQLGYVAR